MRGLVSVETYAVRGYGTGKRWPGGRIGFSWNDATGAPPATKRQFERIADRRASASRPRPHRRRRRPRTVPAVRRPDYWYSCTRNVRGARANGCWTTFDYW
jgi:hypothetical protein